MRKQQAIWLQEHIDQGTLPTMANVEAASGVIQFIEWLKDHNVRPVGRAVDIGAGKGRNSVYMATLGYEVWALEYIEPALKIAKALSIQRNVDAKIHFELSEVDRPWHIPDSHFDIAIDSFSSIDIETKEGREVCRDQMFRTLKSGGYALINVCSADDEWEKEVIANHPGPEPNSTLWPQNGKFQKDYAEDELRAFYEGFEIIELNTIRKPAYKLGREGTATNFWMVLRKP